VQELNTRILMGCPAISAPACLHLHHLPFSPRRPLPYPLTWLGEMKHMGDMPLATRPVRHCRRRRLESYVDPAANSGGRRWLQYSIPRHHDVEKSMLCSAPGNIVALWRSVQYICASRLSLSSHKGPKPPTRGQPQPACLLQPQWKPTLHSR
jgi:hypothetical protein